MTNAAVIADKPTAPPAPYFAFAAADPGPGTVSFVVLSADIELCRVVQLLETTTSGVLIAPPEPASALQEIKETLGLSWEEVAELFGVSRRTIHYWVEGSGMAESNRERLRGLTERVRRLAAETPAASLTARFKESRPGEPSLFRQWCAEARRDRPPVFRLSDTLDVAEGPSGVEPYEVIESRPMPEPTREL